MTNPDDRDDLRIGDAERTGVTGAVARALAAGCTGFRGAG